MAILDSITSTIGNAIGLNVNLDKTPPSEGFDINRFISESVSQTGVMKSNLFLVKFTLPKYFQTTSNDKALSIYCEAAPLPGVIFATDESVRRYGVGPSERRPYLPVFSSLDLSFIGDGRGQILKFFQAWMNSVINFDSSKGMIGASRITGALPYEVSYKDDYIAQMDIIMFDEAANKIIETQILNVFPKALGDIGLAWAITDDFVRIPVRFEYKDWNTNYYDPAVISNLQDSSIGNLNFIQKLVLGGTIYQTISSMRKPQNISDIINVVGNASILTDSIPNLF